MPARSSIVPRSRRANASSPPSATGRWPGRWLCALLLALVGTSGVACKRPVPSPTPEPAASAVASSTATGAFTELRLTRRAPAVGEARVEHFERELRVPPPVIEGKSVGPGLELLESIERRVEVHSLNEERIGGLIVEYRRVERTRDGKADPDPRAGQRFLVRLRDGALEATGADGAAIPTALAELVSADHPFLDATVPFAQYLPEGPLAPGQVVEPSHDAALALWGGEGDFDVRTLRLAFPVEGGAPDATSVRLSTTADFRISLGDRSVDLDLKGEAEVGIATAQLTSLSLAGPAVVVARGPGEHPATGTARIRITSRRE